ncbi:MAG: 50S ribosomal protein L32e [Candidatus Micrarchaeota archaeon]|nr:50S ribosomal protein L32e [Candidatus Micrarchaeota archaeon]
MVKKRKHPKFLRPNFGRSSRKRVKRSWRSQRGIDNKKRLKIKYMGASPSIGYGQPAQLRHKHPIGLPEVLVDSASKLEGLKEVAVRIAGGVGRKKREEIVKKAEALGLAVLNKAKKYSAPEKKKPEEKKAEAPALKQEEKPQGQKPDETKESKS